MDSQNEQYNLLLKALLPSDLFEYFEIIRVIVNPNTIDVHLDELNNKPEDYSNENLFSKGFHPASIIQDFPIRERSVYLHVRRRKWLVESTGTVVSRDWDIVAKGARYTEGFASFLKELFGQIPDK